MIRVKRIEPKLMENASNSQRGAEEIISQTKLILFRITSYSKLKLPGFPSYLESYKVNQYELVYSIFSLLFIWFYSNTITFLAATKQLYEWYLLSVCPSVRLSVTPFWLCSHHRIIMKFSGVITLDQGKVHAKGQGQRSKVKVTEVTTQIFVSGLELQFEFTYDDKIIHIAWCCLGEVPYCFSRSSVKFQGHTALKSPNLTQIGRFRTVTPVWIHQWLWNAAQSLK